MTAPSRVPISVTASERILSEGSSVLHGRSRDTEVENLGRSLGRDLDVGRLEIAMHDAALVRSLERGRDLLREAQRVRQAEATRASCTRACAPIRSARVWPSTSSRTRPRTPALSSMP